MMTCICGETFKEQSLGTHRGWYDCIRSVAARLAALESAQRPKPTYALLRLAERIEAINPAHMIDAPWLARLIRESLADEHESAQLQATPPAPGDATGGDDGLELREFLEDMADEQRHGKLNTESPLRATAYAKNERLLRLAAIRLDELRRERDARLQCTRAWAVANQRADEQKSRADGGRDVLDKLDELRREQGVIAIGDGLRVGRHWVEALQARADAAEAKVDKLTDAIFWALGEGGSDFHKHVGPNQPQYSWRARLRELMKDALTTPAQRSESNDGG
jgi:hypothetical protein